MSRENKSFSFSVIMFIVIWCLVLVVYSVMDPVLKGSGEADMSEEAIAARISPVGKLNTGEAMAPAAAEAAPAEAAAAAAPEAEAGETATAAAGRSGESIYNSTCLACHATGAAGAPKLGDKDAWAPRIAAGMDALMNTALNGKGAMPPRGTCGNCSDEELKATIEYMVSQSQ